MIIVNDEKALRVKCEDVLADEVDDLIKILEKELHYSKLMGRPGIGLAAPQIGIAKNIAIVRIIDNGSYDLNVNLVNAKIENAYDEFIFKDEGCLSFPGRLENTKRFNEIHVVNNLVYPHKFIATGLMSVVIQHELDHLNSKLLIDNALPRVNLKPNDKCLCGSGKKYKKCCQLKENKNV